MPAISQIADIVTDTLPTFEQGKYDAVGLAQLYPDYEYTKQMIQGARKQDDVSYLIDRTLEIGAPSSYEHTYTNHPMETATHPLSKRIQTPMVKVRTKCTFSEDEEELQGKTVSQIVNVVQKRLTKWRRDFIEGIEHDFLSKPTSSTQHPAPLRGLAYWVTDRAGITLDDGVLMHGGDDPSGFPTGAGGILRADEARWPNAVCKFAKVSDDDLFDKIEQFLNRVRTMAVIPNPSQVSEVPARVLYTIEPIKRAVSRYMTANNDNTGDDAGVYRGASYYKGIPITVWHALSDPSSPVKATTGVMKLIDWNSFEYIVHSNFDQKITGPTMLPNVPGQMVLVNETWHGLHCNRRDRNMQMTTDTAELQPSAA
jgi:hypothetical protein